MVGMLLRSSRQVWKLLVMMGTGVVGFFLCLYGVTKGSPLGALVGAVVILAGFTWCATSLRCPRCGTRLLLYAATRSSLSTWFEDVVTAPSCPTCSYPTREDV